ncbi:MAG: hypothetical protein ACLVJK_07250 [Alistipes putredinis]
MSRRGCGGHILNMASYSLWMPIVAGTGAIWRQQILPAWFSVAFAKEVPDRTSSVTAVCPAGVATDLYGLPPRWLAHPGCGWVCSSPDSCARRALKALWRNAVAAYPAGGTGFSYPSAV